MIAPPLVNVIVGTYNHAQFIAECLEGILKQQTNFDFDILLGEDDSTDGTREICVSYSKRYPEKIKLVLHDRKNVIYINGRATGRYNFFDGLKRTNAKYIAICDGDDCWTDPLKLQKQIDLLEKNNDVELCFTGHTKIYNGKHILNTIASTYFTFSEYIEKTRNSLPACSSTAVFRNSQELLNEYMSNFKLTPSGDFPLFSLLLNKGKGYFLADNTINHRYFQGLSKSFKWNTLYEGRIPVFEFLIKHTDTPTSNQVLLTKRMKDLSLSYSLSLAKRLQIGLAVKHFLLFLQYK